MSTTHAPSETDASEPTITSVEDVRRRVEHIAAIVRGELRYPGGVEPQAHAEEDALHQGVLRAIAKGAPDGAELARAALQTLSIAFSRWCE